MSDTPRSSTPMFSTMSLARTLLFSVTKLKRGHLHRSTQQLEMNEQGGILISRQADMLAGWAQVSVERNSS